MAQLDYPYRPDARGRTALAGRDAHLRDLIEQLLFTHPGERVNRPDFGSGLLQLVFAPAGAELAASLQLTVQASLERWLGERIAVEGVEVTAEESTLRVVVRYRPLPDGEPTVAEFAREV